MTGYSFDLTCPNCGGELEQINAYGTPVRRVAITKCANDGCRRQFEVHALLLPFAQVDSRRRASYRVQEMAS